jgi:hypothetical protein
MNTRYMQKVQRSGDSVWSLPARASTTLRVGPGPRVVQVCEGRLWVTATGTRDAEPVDVWLAAGDTLDLPDGLTVVVEAWPSARFQLLVPPQACDRSHPAPIVARAAAWMLAALRGQRRPAALSSALYAH